MKKILALLLAMLMLVLAGCSQSENPSDEESSAGEIIIEPSDPGEDAARELGITEETIERAKYFFADPSLAKNDAKIVYTGNSATDRIEIIEDFLSVVKQNEGAAAFGLMAGNTTWQYFEINYVKDAGMELVLILNSASIEPMVLNITKVYDAKHFYCFEDENGNSFSILKTNLSNKQPMIGYAAGNDLSGAAVTADNAAEAAVNITKQLEGKNEYRSENEVKGKSYGYGSVIKNDYSGYFKFDGELEGKVESAYIIMGEAYYCVRVYHDGVDCGDVYYVAAEDPDEIFMVSMVNGNLVPVSADAEVIYEK